MPILLELFVFSKTGNSEAVHTGQHRFQPVPSSVSSASAARTVSGSSFQPTYEELKLEHNSKTIYPVRVPIVTTQSDMDVSDNRIGSD